MPRVNIIENLAKGTQNFDFEYISNMHCEPRPSEKRLGNRAIIRTPWDFNLSVFRTYRPDNDKLIA